MYFGRLYKLQYNISSEGNGNMAICMEGKMKPVPLKLCRQGAIEIWLFLLLLS